MKYDLIETTLKNGGVLQLSYSKDGFQAEMDWPWNNSIFSGFAANLPDALTSLNTALQDDAADECDL